MALWLVAPFRYSDIGPLSQLALYVLSPALVIDGLYRTELSLNSSTKLLLGFALTSVSLYLIVNLINRLLKLPDSLSRAITAVVMFPNNGNMGLPVATFALGAAGLDRAIIYMLGSSFLMFCFGPAMIRGNGIIEGFKLTFKTTFAVGNLVWRKFAPLRD